MDSTDLDRSRIPALDGLRGLACLAVFGVHFHQHTGISGRYGYIELDRLLKNGNTGVALFFILSGFLLGLPYWSGRVNSFQELRIGPFALRRIGRIVPAYFLCMTALVLLHRHGSDAQEWVDIALHYLFLHNYAEFSFYSISEPFWTLAVQAQFYLLFPMMLTVMRRFDPWSKTPVLGLGLLAVGAYGLHWGVMTWAHSTPTWPFPPNVMRPHGAVLSLSVLAHLPHFLLGIVAGRFFLEIRTRQHPSNLMVSPIGAEVVCWAAGVMLLLILSTPLDGILQVPYGRYNLPYVPVLITSLILFAPLAPMARRLLDAWPLRALGVISYGVYVYHLACQNVTAKFMQKIGFDAPTYTLIFGLSSLALTIAVATVSYHAVEQPILRATRPRDLHPK